MKYNFLHESNIVTTWAKDSLRGMVLFSILPLIKVICKRFKDPKIRRVEIIHELESKYSLNKKLINTIDDNKKIEKLKQQNLQIQIVLSKIRNMSDKQLKNWSTGQDIIKSLKTSAYNGMLASSGKAFIRIGKYFAKKEP